MSVSEWIAARVGLAEEDKPAARLPDRLRLDRASVHVGVLKRLSAQRHFSGGGSAGILRRAGAGRPFRLDVRQRVIVKALVSRQGAARKGSPLAKHISYLARTGTGREGEAGEFYGAARAGLDAKAEAAEWINDRHHFRFIISPEHGDRIQDLTAYIRETMARVTADLREPNLQWMAVNHFDTDQPHAHVLVRGRREDGRDLVIPRPYIGYGFRARAQEVAQELLGDITRDQAERRVWAETTADRVTRFDRSLMAEAESSGGLLPDGWGRPGSYGALLRGRLAHLEALGLAHRDGGAVRLHARLEPELRGLQLRGDIIRTLNQRRIEGVDHIQELGDRPVRGRVVSSGFHDELGSSPYVIVRTRQGEEYYGRLRLGSNPPELLTDVQLVPIGSGAVRVVSASRDRSL